jgi:hypothetical protein
MVRATVVSINAGLTAQGPKGEYEYMDFVYQPEPYQGKAKDQVTRKVFGNTPLYNEVLAFKEGDVVEMEFEKNGKYTNMISIRKGSGSASGGGSQSSQSAGNSGSSGSSTYLSFDQRVALDDKKDESIQRQVALKAAVELYVAAMPEAKTKFVDVDEGAVLKLAADLFGFLRNTSVNMDDEIPF